MSGKLKAQLIWIPVLIAYLSLPSPFGWYVMLAFIIYSFFITAALFIIVKSVDPNDMKFEYKTINECKTDILDWIIFVSSFTACMIYRDFALGGGVVMILYVELEVFRITGQIS